MEFLRIMNASLALKGSINKNAVECACYIKNRVTHTGRKNRTPFQLWFGHKPDLSRMRVFGCLAAMRNPEKHLQKFDSRSHECLLFV